MEALALLLLGHAMHYVFTNGTEDEEFDISQYKNPNSFDLETRKIIDTVTLQDDIDPVGSQKYKVHRYPGDIDIFEPIKVCCSLDDATHTIVKNIQKMMKEIKKEPLYFLGDFKAGLDHRFQIDLTKKNTEIISQLMDLRKKNLLTSEEVGRMLDLLKRGEINELKEALRQYYVVRWTIQEIMDGVKKLPGDLKLSLFDAIKHNTIVKLDLWAPINNNYTEITNFLLLMYVDENGKQHIINIELEDRVKSLIKDIKLYSTPEHKKSLKVAKRMWALAQVVDDHETIKKLYPLFSSDAAILSQITSEIETLTLMLSKIDQPPLDIMIRQIDRFKSRIGTIFLDLDENTIFGNIDIIVSLYNQSGNRVNRQVIITLLKHISLQLNQVIEKYSSEFMKKRNLLDPNYYDYLLKWKN